MKHKSVGESIFRVDAPGKVTGKTLYPQDLYREGMLWGVTLRSTEAHARITVDTRPAEAMAGVRLVLTHRDVPGLNRHGVLFKDHDVLARDKVRRIGDPIAFIVADTRHQAEAARDAVVVDYEILPALFDARQAMADTEHLIHEGQPNLLYQYNLKKGNADEAIAKSAFVARNTYELGSVEHMFLQPEAGMAWMEDDIVVVSVSTQYPHFDVTEIAEALDLPEDRIRYLNPAIGGAFGGREDISMQIHLALAALTLNAPVKCVLEREESFYAHSKRHAVSMDCETACDENGKLTAVKARFYGDTGAYASWAVNVMRKCGVHGPGPYEVPNVDIESYAVYTNNPYAGAMRGFGATQSPLAYEPQMDELARLAGISPAQIRRINMLRNGSVTATGQNLLDTVPLDRCLDAVEAYFSAHPMEPSRDPAIRKGRGIALAYYGTGYGNGFPDVSSAQLELTRDGRFNLFVSAAECGQGSDTAMLQIAAEAIGCATSRINGFTCDTKITTDSGTAAASRQTYNTGNAIRLAAEKLHRKLTREAQACLKLNSDLRLEMTRDGIELTFDPSFHCSYEELAAHIYQDENTPLVRAEAVFTAQTTTMDPATGQGNPYWPYTFGACGVEVEVDVTTGKVRVTDAISAQDVGRAINPTMVEGQMDGGFAMGLGYALMEDLGLSKGKIKNNSFTGYIIPTSMDMPDLKKVIIEDPEATGPFGAKGIGEPVMTYVAPAILNAIYDAAGIRMKQIPASPDRVLKALARQTKTATPAKGGRLNE